MIQPTSLLSYQDIILSLGKRQTEVLKSLKECEPANNRMLAKFMNRPINTVTGRVFELRAKGLIVESHLGIDEKTLKSTIFWKTNLK